MTEIWNSHYDKKYSLGQVERGAGARNESSRCEGDTHGFVVVQVGRDSESSSPFETFGGLDVKTTQHPKSGKHTHDMELTVVQLVRQRLLRGQ